MHQTLTGRDHHTRQRRYGQLCGAWVIFAAAAPALAPADSLAFDAVFQVHTAAARSP